VHGTWHDLLAERACSVTPIEWHELYHYGCWQLRALLFKENND